MSGEQHQPTPGPWLADLHRTHDYAGHAMIRAPNHLVPLAAVVLGVEGISQDEGRANARVLAASWELLAAAEKLEEAESAHANCRKCVSELCERCFLLFDDARVMRRNAIAKARG